MDQIVIDIWNSITGVIPAAYLGIAGTIVLVANLVTMQMASTSDNKYVAFGKKVLNILALNIMKNRNADDAPK